MNVPPFHLVEDFIRIVVVHVPVQRATLEADKVLVRGFVIRRTLDLDMGRIKAPHLADKIIRLIYRDIRLAVVHRPLFKGQSEQESERKNYYIPEIPGIVKQRHDVLRIAAGSIRIGLLRCDLGTFLIFYEVGEIFRGN